MARKGQENDTEIYEPQPTHNHTSHIIDATPPLTSAPPLLNRPKLTIRYLACNMMRNQNYMILVHVLLLAFPILITSFHTFTSTSTKLQLRHRATTTSTTRSTCNTSTLLLHAQPPEKLILPIFPLRKRVKFPTESLKLTLWEERYKALSRHVLDHHHPSKQSNNVNGNMNMNTNTRPMFGALYCSHKTQIVKGGNKPITPLVEPGDIGIICSVTSSQVYINGKEVDASRKYEEEVEKIRLWGLGVGRFRVDKVLSNGLDNNVNGKKGSLPFILVEGTRIDDDDVFEQGQSEQVERILRQLLDRDSDDSFDESKLASDDYDYAFAFQQGNEEYQKRQMMTFALISKLEATAPANEMLDMLRCTSTLERLKYLERKLPRPKGGLLADVSNTFRFLFE